MGWDEGSGGAGRKVKNRKRPAQAVDWTWEYYRSSAPPHPAPPPALSVTCFKEVVVYRVHELPGVHGGEGAGGEGSPDGAPRHDARVGASAVPEGQVGHQAGERMRNVVVQLAGEGAGGRWGGRLDGMWQVRW